MECPYCYRAMKLGSIDVYDTLSWSPHGEKRKGATKYAVAKNGIVLAKYNFISAVSKEAYFCEECKKIILDVK